MSVFALRFLLTSFFSSQHKPMAGLLQWAQRRKNVLVWCAAPENTDVEITIEATVLHTAWTSRGMRRVFVTPLFAPVHPAPISTFRVTGMGVQIRLAKVEESAPFWSKLTSEKGKLPHITVHWSLWKDEDEVKDEEEEEETKNFGKNGGASPYIIQDGITIGGGGDPDKVAALMKTALSGS